MSDIRAIIVKRMHVVAEEINRTLAPLTDDLPLRKCGLDSLTIAVLFADLEDELHLDPFGLGGLSLPITFGDLVRGYEHAKV